VRRAIVVCAVLLLAGCGGGTKRISADHATMTDVEVGRTSVDFAFDVLPDTVKTAYAARGSLAECGSGAPVQPNGSEFLVVHFTPAQTQGLPKRIIMPSGVVRDVWKVCDFEADVGWAIGLSRHLPVGVDRHGGHVILTFG
jgi:hypothetical protein